MSTSEYRFDSRWFVPMPSDVVYDRLADIASYPRWWPQVRAVAKIDARTAFVVCRSLLPYGLHLELTSTRQDPEAGVLEAGLDGHLMGWSRWTIREEHGGTRLHYEQEVVTPGRLLRVASRVARPVLVANHSWMMRGCRRGIVGAPQGTRQFIRSSGGPRRAEHPSGRQPQPPPRALPGG